MYNCFQILKLFIHYISFLLARVAANAGLVLPVNGTEITNLHPILAFMFRNVSKTFEAETALSSAQASKKKERKGERKTEKQDAGDHGKGEKSEGKGKKASFRLPRDISALTILVPSPPIYLLLSLALQPPPPPPPP